MAARKTLVRAAGLALTAALLWGCGSDDAETGAKLSDAERLVGAALLPPDGAVTTAGTLLADDLPPDSAAAVADDDLPPAG